MFVRKAKYEAALRQILIEQEKLAALTQKWNKLVNSINAKGGQEFLDEAVMPKNAQPIFSRDEIRTLIKLTHPDKHGGSKEANDITAKLIKMQHNAR